MQLSLYLDSETEYLVKAAAAAEGVSLSRWVSTAVQEKTRTCWPKTVVDAAGAFPDWPATDLQSGTEAPRENWD